MRFTRPWAGRWSCALGIVIACAAGCVLASPSLAAGHYSVQWSKKSVAVTVPQGQSGVVGVTIVAKVPLRHVRYVVGGEIKSLVRVSPGTSAVLGKGKKTRLRLTVSPPAGTALGVYHGTLTPKRGGKTLGAALRITVAVVGPGGARGIAFIRSGDIWLMNVDGTSQKRLVATGAVEANPFWSPDGNQLYFSRMTRVTSQTDSDPEGEWGLFRYDMASGAVQQVQLEGLGTQAGAIEGDVSPDGSLLAVVTGRADYNGDGELTVRSAESGRIVLKSPILPNGESAWGTEVLGVSWSPDGSQLAFEVGKTPQYGWCICIADATSGEVVRTVDRWGYHVDWSRRDKFAVDWGGDPDTGISVVDAFTGDDKWTSGGGVGGPLDPAWSPDGNVLAYTSFDTSRKNWPTSITAVDPVRRDSQPWLIAQDGESPAWRP